MISAQRRHQHRHPDSHHLSARRHGVLSRWARRCSTIPCRPWKSAKRASRPPAFSAPWARRTGRSRRPSRSAKLVGAGARLLLVDNDDCFIHTLANYARQTGAEVVTYRAGFPPELIERVAPDLILISPGPGPPGGFRRARTGEDRRAAGRAGVRRLPGTAGHCGGVRRRAGRARLPRARQALHGAPPRHRRFRRDAGRVCGGPLPFAVRAAGDISRPAWK